CTITYQLRISVSISNAHDVSRSAGHWKRKLLMRKAASITGRVLLGSRATRRLALHRRLIERETKPRRGRRHELTVLDPRHRREDLRGPWDGLPPLGVGSGRKQTPRAAGCLRQVRTSGDPPNRQAHAQ